MPGTFTIDIDFGPTFDRVVEQAEQNAKKALGGALVAMSNKAKALAPRGSTGTLANSIRAGAVSGSLRGGDLHGELSASAPGAEAQEFGSGLHGERGAKYPIEPRLKKALRFPIAGFIGPRGHEVHTGPLRPGERRFASSGFAFSRGVMHPGVKAKRFLQQGVESKIDMLEGELTAAIQLAVLGDR